MESDVIGYAKRDLKAGETITINLELGSNEAPHSEEIEVAMSKTQLLSLDSKEKQDEVSGD